MLQMYFNMLSFICPILPILHINSKIHQMKLI